MKKTPTKTEDALVLRAFLQNLARHHTGTKQSRADLLVATGISKSLFEQMIYHGKGGLDSWVAVLMYILKIDSNDAVEIVSQLSLAQRAGQGMTPAERAIQAAISKLDDDRKVFWSQIIEFTESIESKTAAKKSKRPSKKRVRK